MMGMMDREQNSFRVPCVFPVKHREALRLVEEVPGSKSITNRALLLATMAKGTSVLDGVLFSEDSRHFLSCIEELGFPTEVEEDKRSVSVTGFGGTVPKKNASIYVGSAGTAARFLSAYLGVLQGEYELDASQQMRRRPMAPLLDSLKELGCEISYEKDQGCFPFRLRGHGFTRDDVSVEISQSSQFLSALLISAVLAEKGLRIHLQGSHGMAYVKMTQKMMEQFGVRVRETTEEGCLNYEILPGQQYTSRLYEIEPDVSAACYFYAMAPLLGLEVQVKGVHFSSLQGDIAFLHVLEQMGCTVWEEQDGIVVRGQEDGVYRGVEADLSAFSDQAITLAALAPFADSPTLIRGIGHIRLQESDRMKAIVTELRRLGIFCEASSDSIRIEPGTPKPGLVHTYEDHRMAMGFSLLGLRTEGIVIDNPQCCKKTFEDYFTKLWNAAEQLRK